MSIISGLKKGDTFEDGGRIFVIDEVITDRQYISHVVEDPKKAKNKPIKEEKDEMKEDIIETVTKVENENTVSEGEAKEGEETNEEVLIDNEEEETLDEAEEADDRSKLDAKDFEQHSKSELLEMAAKFGLEVNAKMKKDELVTLLANSLK